MLSRGDLVPELPLHDCEVGSKAQVSGVRVGSCGLCSSQLSPQGRHHSGKLLRAGNSRGITCWHQQTTDSGPSATMVLTDACCQQAGCGQYACLIGCRDRCFIHYNNFGQHSTVAATGTSRGASSAGAHPLVQEDLRQMAAEAGAGRTPAEEQRGQPNRHEQVMSTNLPSLLGSIAWPQTVAASLTLAFSSTSCRGRSSSSS